MGVQRELLHILEQVNGMTIRSQGSRKLDIGHITDRRTKRAIKRGGIRRLIAVSTNGTSLHVLAAVELKNSALISVSAGKLS